MQEKQLKDDLLQQTEEMSKYHDTEKKAKTMEEKFQKLKEVYTKLREEHIQLIRQKADVDKQLVSAKSASETAVRSKAEAEAKLLELTYEKQKTEGVLQQASAEALVEVAALHRAQEEAASQNEALSSKVGWALKEKSALEEELQDLLAQKEDLDVRLREVEERTASLGMQLRAEAAQHRERLLVACVTESEAIVQNSVHEVDNPAISAVICTPDYFQTLAGPVKTSLDEFYEAFKVFAVNSNGIEEIESVVKSVVKMSHLLANFLLQGKTTSNSSPDIEFGDRLCEVCKGVGAESLRLLACVREEGQSPQVSQCVEAVRAKVETVVAMVAQLTSALKGHSPERIEDLLDDELQRMDTAIEEAAQRIEEMLSKSRAADSGLKLEVNEKILDSCTVLMRAIRVLVQKSRVLQAEIVAQGKGTASAKEFYKRNHQWTEGLISAAKAVGVGAKFLLGAADKVVSGQGKLEALVVASQEIAACTAQLVVASRVKAERRSKSLSELSQASKGVTQATGGVVATAKDCAQMVEESEDLDVTGLSLHQAKRLEMESQVRVLELEQALTQERVRLAALRKQHYQLAGEVEGWDAEAIQQNV